MHKVMSREPKKVPGWKEAFLTKNGKQQETTELRTLNLC